MFLFFQVVPGMDFYSLFSGCMDFYSVFRVLKSPLSFFLAKCCHGPPTNFSSSKQVVSHRGAFSILQLAIFRTAD